jgi:hypothetical protein
VIGIEVVVAVLSAGVEVVVLVGVVVVVVAVVVVGDAVVLVVEELDGDEVCEDNDGLEEGRPNNRKNVFTRIVLDDIVVSGSEDV